MTVRIHHVGIPVMTENETEIRRAVRAVDGVYGETPIAVLADIKFLLTEIDELRALIREQDHRISCARMAS